MTALGTDWSAEIRKAMSEANDDGPIVFCSISEEQLQNAFHPGFSFIARTEERVYFPVYGDGLERVDSVPRRRPSE